MGSHLAAFVSSGGQTNHVCHLPEILVAGYGIGGPGVHRGLFGLCSQQNIFQGSRWTATTAPHPIQTLVGHFFGLCHRAPGLPGKHYGPHCGGSILENGTFHCTTETTTAEVMMTQVFRVHGFPKDIVSDRGPQFVSKFWREFCKLIGATASLTSGYHPEANGQAERLNQQLETGLRCVVHQNPSTWSKPGLGRVCT